jgi:hypothetical protein
VSTLYDAHVIYDSHLTYDGVATQGGRVQWALSAAFGIPPTTTPAPGDWIDLTPYLRGGSTKRGRQHELDKTQAGEMSVRLKNTDRRFDPSNAASPYYPNVVPMTPIRLIGTTPSNNVFAAFYGFVENWNQAWSPRPIASIGDAECQVLAVDAFKLFSLDVLAVYSGEVVVDAPLTYIKLDEPPGSGIAIEYGTMGNVWTYDGAEILGSPGPLSGQTAALFPGGAGSAVEADLDGGLKLLADFTFEAFAKPTHSGGVTGIAAHGDTHGGALWEVAYTTTDKLRLIVVTSSGTETFTSGTTWTAGTWQHLAITRAGQVITFYRNGVAIDTFTQAGVMTDPGFSSPLVGEGWINGRFLGSLAHVAMYDKPLPANRIASHYVAKVDAISSDLTGAVIGHLLDAIGWPAGARDIDGGQSVVQTLIPSGSPLDTLLAVGEDTESGQVFMRRDGLVQFQERASFYRTLALGATVNDRTFGDGGTEVAYANLVLANDDLDLWTAAVVTRNGGAPQSAEDLGASAKYGRRVLTRSTLAANDDESASAASYYVGKYAAPRTRAKDLVIIGDSDQHYRLQLSLDLTDRITVKRRPPGGGAVFQQDCIIEGVEHTFDPPASFVTVFHLVPADTLAYWFLDDPVRSVLDSTTRLAY